MSAENTFSYRSCEHCSNKFSLEANKKHYEKNVKAKKADGAKEEDPFKSSGACQNGVAA